MSTESVPLSTSAAAADPVAQKVCELVAKSLARDPAEVKLANCLMEDLGAESLDFLDIVFELERAFNIQITRGEMERAARGDMSEEEFAPNGTISEVGLRRLRELMPEVSHRIHAGLRPAQILSLFTVQTFVNLVSAKQQGRTA
jgi:acyl carrier protein